MTKNVYFFGGGKSDGNAGMKNLLGGKGANLAEMTNLGLPVPAGFTITTEVCTYFQKSGGKFPTGIEKELKSALTKVEKEMGAKFGDRKNPLLVSVRSGARASMPGMMDTVLNLGLNDETVKGIIEQTGNERFAYDSYRRFVAMYGDVVMDVEAGKDGLDPFEKIIEAKKHARGVKHDVELTAADLKELVAEFKAMIKQNTGKTFPEDPEEQLWGAIKAVFNSWNNERAIIYRKMNKIPDEWGTAVNVQSMVYGNMGDDSGTGVAFTRDPSTGENVFYGEFLMNAQGEDVVAGVRTPESIEQLAKYDPQAYKQLVAIRTKLEKHYKDMQDLEFTVQKGKLYMLQTRNGKRTGLAEVRIAVEMAEEGIISKEEALMRIQPDSLNQLLQPIFDPKDKAKALKEGRMLAKGLNAGPGAAAGHIVFSANDAFAKAKKDYPVILVRIETSPDDIKGMKAANGILTARGGMTAHAAVVGRQMGKVCVVGCGALEIDYVKQTLKVGDKVLHAGDMISIDGSTGQVIAGEIKTIPSEVIQVLISKTLKAENAPVYQQFAKLMSWADKARKLGVRTNADQPDQAANAIAFGAEGIGLCRTEHMFFGEGKIEAFQEMIVAENLDARRKALKKILPLQRKDFEGIFKTMEERPVTIRTLDPPLHEFVPHTDADVEKLSKSSGVPVEKIKERAKQLEESNPMLGHRGCRLGIYYPEITEMQVQAIFEAACNVQKRYGIKVHPEIMIPLVGHINELNAQAAIVRRVAEEVFAAKGMKIDYLLGTMIELPRAALTADQIAQTAEFFSFGTNDLTQTGYGLSRDDAGRFLSFYEETGILKADPFATLDTEGIGQLVQIGVQKGRSTNPNLKIGICGEHGGDPKSVAFCHQTGLNYVSCSPFRVPIARIAAAQAAIEEKKAQAPAKKVATPAKGKKVVAKKAVAVKKPAVKTVEKKEKAAVKKAPAKKAAPAKKPAAKKAKK